MCKIRPDANRGQAGGNGLGGSRLVRAGGDPSQKQSAQGIMEAHNH